MLFETPSPADWSINILRGKKVTTNPNNDSTLVSGSLDFHLSGQSEDPTTQVEAKRLLCSHDVAGVTDSKTNFQNLLVKNRLCLRILVQKVHSKWQYGRITRYNH